MSRRLDLPVSLPEWARESGIPKPKEGEMFRAYWTRLGMTEQEISGCFDGLRASTVELASVRMAHLLRLRVPQVYERYLARRFAGVATSTGSPILIGACREWSKSSRATSHRIS